MVRVASAGRGATPRAPCPQGVQGGTQHPRLARHVGGQPFARQGCSPARAPASVAGNRLTENVEQGGAATTAA
eukprot:4534399-Pleurochrysis_carterae.AAC.1